MSEEGMLNALKNGRSIKKSEGQWDHRSIRRSFVHTWDHEEISVVKLEAALVEMELFPRPTDTTRALGGRARRAITLRTALEKANLSQPTSWRNLAEALDGLDGVGDSDDEVTSAREELNDARDYYEKGVKEHLQKGKCIKKMADLGAVLLVPPAEVWERSELKHDALLEAVVTCDSFPRPVESTKALIKTGRFISELRSELALTDWGSAATWEPLAAFVDVAALEVRPAEIDEYDDAVAQLTAMGAATERAVKAALASGRSVQKGDGWSHEGIEVTPLQAAADECANFPRPSSEAHKLVSSARTIVQLRTALLAVEEAKAPTWAGLANVLASMPADDLGLGEVRSALLEFRMARDVLVSAVHKSMRDGCSQPPSPPSLKWDHSNIDAEGVVQAALNLEAFPRIEREGAPIGRMSIAGAEEAAAKRSSIAPKRASMAGVTGGTKRVSLARTAAEAEELVTSAKKLARLRTLLKDEDWAEVQVCVDQLEPCLASLHESAGEEVKRARLELVDIYVELEGNVTTALEHGRSKPNVDKNGFWDHSSLLVDELKAAAQALSTYPLKTPAADVLVEKAMSIVAVREKLFTCSWGQLAHVLKGFSPEVVAIDEIAQAAVELEQMRTATESALREALLVGRSVKVVGTKKIRMGADWFVNVEWDHSGINDGLERLETAAQVVREFPPPRADAAEELLAQTEHSSKLRTMCRDASWGPLRALLEASEGGPFDGKKMDEAGMAWQELLCHELSVATGSRGVPSDQAGLKVALAQAAVRGLLPHEAPVFRALDKFIDPPEFQIDLEYEGDDVFPDPDTGRVVLSVKVRAATTLRWLKNGVELKEGADGGRITGVTTETLSFSKIVGRDTDQKVYCEATNKWGVVKSKVVYLRISDEARLNAPKVGGADIRVTNAVAATQKQEHKKNFTKSAAILNTDEPAKALKPTPAPDDEAPAAEEAEAAEAAEVDEESSEGKPRELRSESDAEPPKPRSLGSESKKPSMPVVGEDEAVTEPVTRDVPAKSIGDAFNKFGSWVGDRVRSLSGQGDKEMEGGRDKAASLPKPPEAEPEEKGALGRQFSSVI